MKKNITISNRSYFDNLIWMSYRYCIGRHTIAAHAHASDIIENSYNDITDKDFIAKDMRDQINQVVRMSLNVSYVIGSEIVKESDVLTIILKHIITSNNYTKEQKNDIIINSQNYLFNIDINGEVVIEEEKEKDKYKITSLEKLYGDLGIWIKAANILDNKCRKIVTVDYKGEISKYICIELVGINMYTSAEHLPEVKYYNINFVLKNMSRDAYIAPEYIIKVEDKYDK